MSLNYPLNPDTSFESFFLSDLNEVQAVFGETYSQNELVPFNYQKLMLDYITGTIDSIPVRQLVCISNPIKWDEISDESTYKNQSKILGKSLGSAYTYWYSKLLLIPVFQCPGGVVTEIKTVILPCSKQTDPLDEVDMYQIQITLKINWLTIASKSIYA
jgi:hypothetical protein